MLDLFFQPIRIQKPKLPNQSLKGIYTKVERQLGVTLPLYLYLYCQILTRNLINKLFPAEYLDIFKKNTKIQINITISNFSMLRTFFCLKQKSFYNTRFIEFCSIDISYKKITLATHKFLIEIQQNSNITKSEQKIYLISYLIIHLECIENCFHLLEHFYDLDLK